MAMKLAVPAKRSDEFGVNPFDITVSEELRGRSKPPTEEQIIARAESMLEHSQLQPCQVRRIDSAGNLSLILGFTRMAAARIIRTGFVGTDGEFKQDPEFNLTVKVVDCNDQKSFLRNIVENAQRNPTSPIDDAVNQQKLRDRYQLSDTDIMKLYGERNTNRIGKLRKLLLLEEPIQDMVHEGTLAVDPAIALLDLPPGERLAAVNAATSTNGNGKAKVDGSAIKAQVREHHLNDDGQRPEGVGTATEEEDTGKKYVPLSMRELRKYLAAVSDNEDERYDEAECRFAKDMLAFMAGKRKAQGMDNALRRLLEAKPTKR